MKATLCWFCGCLQMINTIKQMSMTNIARRAILHASKLAIAVTAYVVKTLNAQIIHAVERNIQVLLSSCWF